MSRLVHSLFSLNELEELARRPIWVNRISGIVKLVVALAFVICVSTVGKYDAQRMIYMAIYPLSLMTLSDIPIGEIMKKTIIPALAGASVGLLNPLFDPGTIALGDWLISAGWISMFTLTIKSVVLVSSALVLVATTPVEELAGAMTRLKIPQVFCTQFLLLFRYVRVLISETEGTLNAYSMRSGAQSKIHWSSWGSLVGQLFVRASERAFRLHDAMKLRGYSGTFQRTVEKQRVKRLDGLYLVFWIAVFAVLRGGWI